ncbi:MAG: hypothetical protein QOJ94_1188 [Sphingomonadales bacterium]|jgi:hypothetical protein|nr:hypothetical protein [Sphingomonadales bacterium]
MLRGLSALFASLLLLSATPALAGPCRTKGQADAPVAFPRNDASDVPFARSMVPVILPDVTGALPPGLTCTRSTVSTAVGDYVLGGENGEAFPRMAIRSDGKPGPVVYVAASRNAPATFALVVHRQGPVTVVKRFYAGIPTDRRLADDVRAALADDAGIMNFDPNRKLVSYLFTPTGDIPLAQESGPRPDGSRIVSGPQILVSSSGDPALLDLNDGMRHTPSGFACPPTFDGLAVTLMSVDPRNDYLACNYRPGTELRFRPDDPIRYQLVLARPRPGDTPRSVFDQLTASARASLRIKGEHRPPLAIGPAPEPELAAFWDTEDEGVQGAWVGKASGWIVWLRAQYPPSPANDAEAGRVAQIFFTQVGKQVK